MHSKGFNAQCGVIAIALISLFQFSARADQLDSLQAGYLGVFNMKQITMDDLYHKYNQINSEKELILDVRTPEEYAEGHVPGSKNIPHDEVEKHIDQLRGFDCIYIYCRSGKRANYAGAVLELQGLKCLEGATTTGMINWLDAGYPVQK